LGALKLRGSVWWLRYYQRGKRFEESAKTSDRAVAAALLAEREAGKPMEYQPSKRPDAPYHVYIVTDGNPSRCKVGITYELTQRLKQLQTGHPDTLEMRPIVKCDSRRGAQSVEAFVKRTFKGAQLNRGDWYAVPAQMVEAAILDWSRRLVRHEGPAEAPENDPDPVGHEAMAQFERNYYGVSP
jgi:hypothetical protein